MNNAEINELLATSEWFIDTRIGATRLLVCLVCGSLVSTDSVDIPRLHIAWHGGQE